MTGSPPPLRVLHLCYEYPPVGGGGGEACRQMVEINGRHGVENFVLTSRCAGLPARESGPGWVVRRVFSFRRKRHQCSIPEMFAHLLMALPWAVYYQARHRFDLIHVHFAVPGGPLGWVLRLLFGTPYLMTLQGGDVPSFVPEQTRNAFRLLKPFTQPIWRKAWGRFAVSPGLAACARQDYPGLSVEYVPNGVSDDFFQPRAPLAPDEQIGLLFLGRLAVQKRVDLLLTACASLMDLPGWHLHLVGDGPLREGLQEQAGELAGRVTFHGWQERDGVLRVLAGCRVMVLPSFREGLPLAGLQGMASGLALVGSDVMGIHDILTHGENGLLFPPGDVAALSASLRGLLTHRERLQTMGTHAAQAAQAYRWERIAAQYRDIYHDLPRR